MSRINLSLFILVIIVALMVSATYVFAANNTTNTTSINITNTLLSDPKVLITITIQFLLGLAFGYFSVKVLKYLLALLGIVILGAILSVWSIGGSIEDWLVNMGSQAKALWPIIWGFIQTLGILTIGPVTAGVIIGLIIGLLRK
ncbi:hypothetical protein [Staphylothermus hellenicus]|uniref:FUN14 family protein n=1 Tax=Staphylothermus hellenicus (strain DSM 12710 / JCM 10830 / BK20S6-10-b1 / P8) TaxID=591019 RepID=D7D855_STAHD|nr:hypothetical protein [Staphylothermus hellenicus]ADI31951.1 hypothetical protein Shell_0839 [Staphylothermus hellenicus DSM 12710]